MAEGILHHDGGDRFEVYSAGTKPSEVRPDAIEAMKEIGIDISNHRSKSLDEYLGENFDYIITVCDNAAENCPVFPGKAERITRASRIRRHPAWETTTIGWASFAACAMRFASG
jgi:arsenate reductase